MSRPFFDLAYSMFGHWGTGALTLIGGALCIFGGMKDTRPSESNIRSASDRDAI